VRLGGCALEPLFVASASDDDVALAEANTRALGAIRVPELGEAIVDLLALGNESRVVTLGKGVQKLAPLI
jgi:hypothetical protein